MKIPIAVSPDKSDFFFKVFRNLAPKIPDMGLQPPPLMT